jgi:NAD(P)H dehydrogenase (quinone)
MLFFLLGSPWGAGTFAGPKGQFQPSQLELDIAKVQGSAFYEVVSRVNFVSGAQREKN